MYMIYTDSDHVPKVVHEALDSMGNYLGVKVPNMLTSVTRNLDKAAIGHAESLANSVDLEHSDPMVIDSDNESEPEDTDDADLDSDDDAWSPKSPKYDWNQAPAQGPRLGDQSKISATRERIRSDLSLARDAGFRVSLQGSLLEGGREGFVSLSIRVNKLGISDEALQAWHMDPEQYFILLIRYIDGYQSLDTITGRAISGAGSVVTLRVGLYSKYKMGIDETTAAFTKLEDKSKTKRLLTTSADCPNSAPKLGPLFIARPLDELLNDRFLPLLRYRIAMGFPWRGAEEFFNDHQGRNLDNNAPDPRYWAEDQSDKAASLPPIVIMDHLSSNVKEKSLPLLAMQFSLRHLVRCTEFCLVCHCKIEADFEALKPYVCSKPLCLYQYMSLGFGPSIEHEIISQPHVVDLLVSFCYASASAQKLHYLPTGMALMVPTLSPMPYIESMPTARYMPPGSSPPGPPQQDATQKNVSQENTHKARFDPLTRDMLFNPNERPPLQIGSWITYGPPGVVVERYHARVASVLFPTVRLDKPVPDPRNKSSALLGSNSVSQRHLTGRNIAQIPTTLTPATTPPAYSTTSSSSPFQEIEFVIYDQNFDEFGKADKSRAICMLLDTLPSVKQMSNYLLAKGGSDVPLRTWHERVSPAALGILRWIIASNRSCIVQVDSLEDPQHKSEERVFGMPGWMQFRFAQGAPDKEQRFVQSIRKTTSASKHPTMFAWHGSPLHNWHGIVREGLHFEHTAHGRAFGNGVYHALDVSTSLSYSNMYGYGYGAPSRNSGDEAEGIPMLGRWPFSQLKISQALTLNEIVNAPDQFVSKTPHLVVAQLDWIQSRYLFVTCNTQSSQIPETAPTQVLDQDTTYCPVGSKREKLVIPLNAVSKSRRPNTQTSAQKSGDKRRRVDDFVCEDLVLVSDDTDLEDSMVLFPSKDEGNAANLAKHPPATSNSKSSKLPKLRFLDTVQTDFIPGTHDQKSLPLIEPPSYATSSATRTLQRELTATLKTQDTHPLHELGWYIDREIISNMYQWIIELHSFEAHLPLAKDMKSRSLKSVVMEMRFGKDYPMSPPFVRIIRPRFLSFNQGGGGHGTAGGALCMELLTNSGWSAVSNIESVLLQVRLAMSSTDPKPARLEPGPVKDYGVGEAVEAYVRACQMHNVRFPFLTLL